MKRRVSGFIMMCMNPYSVRSDSLFLNRISLFSKFAFVGKGDKTSCFYSKNIFKDWLFKQNDC